MPKVFIGSTSRDLHAYRLAAIDECNRLGLVPIAMEYFEAIGAGATAGSRRKLEDADVYVGIFAHRYGFVEPGEPASVTELEFDHADTRGLERLSFLIDPAHDDAALEELAEPEYRERMAAFRARVEGSVIRQHFTTVDDFRGKVRLALQGWMERTPELRGLHPALSFRLLEPTQENRLRYGAQRMPFVGRARELEQLRVFLEEERGLSWVVVAGAAGSGKSRLVQELCTRISPPWRAGFLLVEPPFEEWARWRPEGPTLIAIDYASEQVDEIRTLLGALTHRGNDAFARTPVRVILVERDADGSWMQRLIGNRSAGYALEQARSTAATVQVGPLTDDELWQGVADMVDGIATWHGARDDLVAAIHTLDPERRPLFALLAADAVAAGRRIGAWDRERLLRDVIGREREAWAAHGVTAEYENLLALATATGGLAEEVLETPPPGSKLPTYRDFDPAIYRAMTGAHVDGDALPPLKPDLLGEFFVLEHVRGRNDRITAQNAKELATAAWRVRGGSRRVKQFNVLTHVFPSSVPLFLQRVLTDYVDHPATPHLLAWPAGEGVDRYFWPELAAQGVTRLADAGRMSDALACFNEMTAMLESETASLLHTGSVITAAFALLPHSLSDDAGIAHTALLDRVRNTELRTHDATAHAFAGGVADAAPALVEAQRGELADQLLERVHVLIEQNPDDQELRSSYARALSLLVTTERPLEAREDSLERLGAFCQEHREDVWLYQLLALAASSLFRTYVADDARAADAERMNNLLRSLSRQRGERPLVRYTSNPEGHMPFTADVVTDDLRTIRLELAESNGKLIPGLVRAGRHREASLLIDEIQRISLPNDAEFAAAWALAVGHHADAIAATGEFQQIPKALVAIGEVAADFPEDGRFPRIACTLARNTVKRAVAADDLATAEEMIRALAGAAKPDGDAQLIADLAEGTLVLCTTYQERSDLPAALRTARAGAWALRSTAAAERWRERGGEPAAQEIGAWVEQMLALPLDGG